MKEVKGVGTTSTGNALIDALSMQNHTYNNMYLKILSLSLHS